MRGDHRIWSRLRTPSPAKFVRSTPHHLRESPEDLSDMKHCQCQPLLWHGSVKYPYCAVFREPSSGRALADKMVDASLECLTDLATEGPAQAPVEHSSRLFIGNGPFCSQKFPRSVHFMRFSMCDAKCLDLLGKAGAGGGNRTRDIQLGKLSFYH